MMPPAGVHGWADVWQDCEQAANEHGRSREDSVSNSYRYPRNPQMGREDPGLAPLKPPRHVPPQHSAAERRIALANHDIAFVDWKRHGEHLEQVVVSAVEGPKLVER